PEERVSGTRSASGPGSGLCVLRRTAAQTRWSEASRLGMPPDSFAVLGLGASNSCAFSLSVSWARGSHRDLWVATEAPMTLPRAWEVQRVRRRDRSVADGAPPPSRALP